MPPGQHGQQGAMVGSSTELPPKKDFIPNGSQEKAVEDSELEGNARRSSSGRACTGCGLGTVTGGQTHAVPTEDKKEDCIKFAVGSISYTSAGLASLCPAD